MCDTQEATGTRPPWLVLGGLLVSDEVVDIFLPVRFYWVRRARWLKLHPEAAATGRLETVA